MKDRKSNSSPKKQFGYFQTKFSSHQHLMFVVQEVLSKEILNEESN